MPTNVEGHWLQLTLAGVIVGLVLWLAVFKGRTAADSTPRGFFLWGSSATAFIVAASYAASMISAFVFVALPGLFYTHGLGGWAYICLPVIFGVSAFAWFGTRLHRLASRTGALSPFEAIGWAYSSRRLGALILCVTALFVIPIIAVQIIGFGRLLEGYDVDYHFSIVGLMSLFIVYTAYAGMRGDVRTDLLQAVLMLIGLLCVTGLVVKAYLADTVDSGETVTSLMTLPGPKGLFTTPRLLSLWILMASLPVVHGHYAMRFMVARSGREIMGAMRWAPLLILLIYLPAAIIGVLGAAVKPGLETGDQLVGALLADSGFGFGTLVGGVVLAGITSASLSSVDSQFIALGAGVSRDVCREALGIKLSEKGQVLVARLTMVVIGTSAIGLALNPPRLVIQLAVFAASGTLTLLPTFMGAVLLERARPSVWVAASSIVIGMAVFIWAALWQGQEAFGGWHPGVVALVASILVYGGGVLIHARGGTRSSGVGGIGGP